MAKPTSSSKVTKQVQFYAEINGYAVTVNNPDFTNAGIISNVDIQLTVDHEEIRIQGSRHLYADILMGVEGVITIDYRLLGTQLLRYGIADPNGPGTIEESLAFLFARKIDGVEMFCLAQGCITEQATTTYDRVPMISQQFYCTSISKWLTEAELKLAIGISGTAAINYATSISDEPWTHLTGSDGNSTSVTVDGAPADITRMTVTVNNNLLKQKPLGYKKVKYVEAGNKVITIAIEPYLYDNQFFDLVNDFTLFDVVGRLKATTPTVDLTITGIKLNSYGDTSDATGGDFITTPVNGTAVEAEVDVF